ncbi:MAG: beta-lactamase family protein [Oscillospiraceae bacterium]|jgi:CubicO group peptidase (beta-lactamase class C family)|nr:beta-lactamase family protein [Oscillospiraceae bacterium]
MKHIHRAATAAALAFVMTLTPFPARAPAADAAIETGAYSADAMKAMLLATAILASTPTDIYRVLLNPIDPTPPASDEETARLEEPPPESSPPAEDLHSDDYYTIQERSKEIAEEVVRISKKYGAYGGVEVAVIAGGEISGTYAYGYAERASRAMTAETPMRVASLSKVVLGMVALSMQEQGIIDIDSDISEYWGGAVRNPYYKDTPITIRHILTHTSSISALGDDASRSGSSIRSRLLGGNAFSRVKPGAISSHIYNNYGFAVLGVTLEVAANETVNSYARRMLFEPLGIDAAFGSGSLINTDNIAVLYRANGAIARSASAQKANVGNTYPGASGTAFAGGLTISASDLAKLIAVLANGGVYNGVRVLSEDSVAQIETSVGYTGAYLQCAPLRYSWGAFGQDAVYWHTGSAYGVFNAVVYNTITRNGVVVLTTGASGAKDPIGIYKICSEITNYTFGLLSAA